MSRFRLPFRAMERRELPFERDPDRGAEAAGTVLGRGKSQCEPRRERRAASYFRSGKSVPVALVMLKTGLSAAQARRRLTKAAPDGARNTARGLTTNPPAKGTGSMATDNIISLSPPRARPP